MLSYPNRISDRATNLAIRKLVDYLNSLGSTADQINEECIKRHIPTIGEIQRALQQGGSNPLNLTGLQPPCPPAAAAGGVTFFSDALTTVDPLSAGAIGPNWIQGGIVRDGDANTAATANAGIGVSTQDGINCLQWHTGGPGAATDNYFGFALPGPILNTAVLGQTQFSQATLVQCTGTARGAGLGCNVYASDTNETFYDWLIIGDKSWTLQRWRNGVPAVLTTKPANSVAFGDVLRLSTDQSVPGQVTLRLTRNGTLDTTFVDNTGSRLVGIGWPGLLSSAVTSADKSEWRTFSCGIGL